MLNEVLVLEMINEKLNDFYKLPIVLPAYVYHGLVDGKKVGSFTNKADCQKIYPRIISSITNQQEVDIYCKTRYELIKYAIIDILGVIEKEQGIHIPSLKKDSLAIHISLKYTLSITPKQILDELITILICFN